MNSSTIPPGGDLFAPSGDVTADLYLPDPSLPAAWVVDMDGTLALGRFDEPGRRGPFDWGRVDEDDPNTPVITLVRALAAAGHRIVVMSGRSDACRDLTTAWMRRHQVPHDMLLMRVDGDYRADTDAKVELFDRHVRHRFHVLGAIDDRDSVVHLWRRLGLMCAQVAPGDF